MNIYIKVKRKILEAYFRLKNKNSNVTIISQNCIGGVIYHTLKMEFNSPTINMFIEDENFLKLVNNLQWYVDQRACAITDKYIDPIDPSVIYPKIRVGDIEICCLHYETCKDAIEAWERRKKRINFDNIVVIGNSWNMHNSEQLIQQLLECCYKTVVFSTEKFNDDRVILLDEEIWRLDARGILRPNITDFIPNSAYRYFEKKWDFISWLNS